MASESGTGKKIFTPLRLLGKIYLKTMKQEASDATGRLIRSLILGIAGLYFLFNLFLVLNIICIFALNHYLQNWLISGVVALGIQGIFTLIFFIMARTGLSRPFFTETKKLFAEASREFQ